MSSASQLWGNSDLTNIQRVIAMAILIMGLIMFAKTAPDMITQTFGLKGGKMNLGIRQKLADGGAFAVGATVAGSGLQGIRNFRNSWAENKGKGVSRFTKSLGSGLAGGASAGARIAYGQLSGGKPAQSLKDAQAAAKKGMNEARDAREKRKEFYDKYNRGEGVAGKIETFVYGHANDLKDNLDLLTSGEVDFSKIEAKQKLASDFDGLKQTLRDKVTTGKYAEVDAAKKAVESLARIDISAQYDRDFAKELKPLESALDAANAALASDPTNADKQTAVANAKRAYEAKLATKEAGFAEAQKKHLKKQQDAQKDLEALQDLYVSRELADHTSSAYQAANAFMTSHRDALKANNSLTYYVKGADGKTLVENASGDSFFSQVESYFGASSISTGEITGVDMRDNSYYREIKIGDETKKIFYKADGDLTKGGHLVYDASLNGGQSLDDFTTAAGLSDADKAKYQSSYDNFGAFTAGQGGKVETNVTRMSDVGKNTAGGYRESQEYTSAMARKAKQDAKK